MNRRDFVFSLAGLAYLPRLQGAVTADQAREIYRRSIVIDCLANPASMNVPWPPHGPLSQTQLHNVARSGMTALNVTVSADTFEATVRNIAFWEGEIEAHPSHFTLIRKHAGLDSAKRDNKLGLILGFQNTEMLARDLTRLDVFRQLGVQIIQLTYNDRNLLGDGCLEPGNAGLSSLGRDAVKRMNELGIAVDLSHCGTQTTADGIATSSKPVIISHSGCREVYRHPRSKEDRELRALADRGGVLGIYMMPFIGGTGAPTEELLLRQIEYALKICGTDHVGIGSDLSLTPIEETPEYRKAHADFVAGRKRRGISAPDEERPLYVPELNHPQRLEGIAVAMARRGHSSAVIEKVIGGNFFRVFREIWGN